MAFPTLTTTTGFTSGGSTTQTLTMPSTLESGDLVIACLTIDGSGTVPTWNTEQGTWTVLKQFDAGAVQMDIAALISDGTEDGLTWTVTTGSQTVSWQILRIPSASFFGGLSSLEISTGTSDSSANMDPDEVTASWGSDDNLFIVVAGQDRGDLAEPTVYPLPDNNQWVSSTVTGGTSTAICSDELAQAALNPGTFTNANDGYHAVTMVVRPAAGGGGTTIPIFSRHYRTMKR